MPTIKAWIQIPVHIDYTPNGAVECVSINSEKVDDDITNVPDVKRQAIERVKWVIANGEAE